MLAAVSLMLSSGFLQLIRHRGCHHAHALSQQPRHGVRSSSSRTLQVRCQANCDPSRSEVSLCVTLLSSGSVWRAPALLGRSAGLLTRGLYLRCLVFGLSSAAPAAPAPASRHATPQFPTRRHDVVSHRGLCIAVMARPCMCASACAPSTRR
eukprot:3341455-Rhodomonas_salina.3